MRILGPEQETADTWGGEFSPLSPLHRDTAHGDGNYSPRPASMPGPGSTRPSTVTGWLTDVSKHRAEVQRGWTCCPLSHSQQADWGLNLGHFLCSASSACLALFSRESAPSVLDPVWVKPHIPQGQIQGEEDSARSLGQR